MYMYKLNLHVYIHFCISYTDRQTYTHALIYNDKKINQGKCGDLGKEIDNSP